MSKRSVFWVTIFAGVFSMVSVASALTFDFAGATAMSQASWTFEVEGITATATARAGDVARNVHWDSYGLGVTFAGDRALEGPAAQIDGRGYQEFLTLTFSEPVTLRDMVLSYWEANDEM